MSTRNGNHAPRLEFEFLESRELLSAVGIPDHHVAEFARVVPALRETLRGSLSGQATIHPVTSMKGSVSFEASGIVIGPSTFNGSDSYSVSKSGVIKYTKGVGTLTSQDGDQIDLSFTGTGRATSTTNFTFSTKGSVKGGTGTYVKAAGTFTGDGSFDSMTDVYSINYTIILKRL